jgi:hypothetical protein
MSAPVQLGAGASTPNRLWTPEVDTNNSAANPNWLPIEFVESCDFNPDEAAMVDATVFADGGYSGQDKLGAAWSATVTVNRMIVPGSVPPAYGTAQEYIRARSIGKFGNANQIRFRIYEFDVNDIPGVNTPRVEAYTGLATCAWPGTGGGAQAEARKIAIPFAGKGKLVPIAHPYPIGASVPTIYAFSPATLAAGGGTPFRVTGSGFTGATAVTLAGTAVTSFTVWSDGEITGVAAAHAAVAGAAIVVTTPTGPSTTGTNRVTYV